jgi:hypothetical protein
MEIISVKIERTYLSFSRERHVKGVCTVLTSRRVYLPQALAGEKGRSRPDGLAKMLHESLKASAIPGKDLALYLGTKTSFLATYKYGAGLRADVKAARQQGEEDRLFENLKEKPLSACYDFGSESSDLVSGAIIASDAAFVKTLTEELTAYGYTVVLVSSSLVGYAEALRPIVRGAGRVLALDVDKSALKAVCFENGTPTVLSETEFQEPFADAQACAQTVTRAAALVTADTKILITGFLSGNPDMAQALAALPGVIYCQPLSFTLKGVKKTIAFTRSLAGKEAMLPGVFSAIGADPLDPQLPDLTKATEREEKRRKHGIFALCIVTLLVAAAACAVPSVNLFLAQRTLEENKAVFLNADNAQMQGELAERRTLTVELSELQASRDLLPKESVSYAALIEELKIGLLLNADLREISFSKGTGLLLDLTTDDAESFDEMKAVIENSGRMEIIEPTEREEIKEGKITITHIRIRVLAGNELR